MIEIHKAVKKDVEAMCTFDHVAQCDGKRKEFISNAVRAGHCWVALFAHQIVGFVVLEYAFYGNGFISLIYIHSDFRRRGIGSALMRHAEALCRTEKLFTSTNQSNRSMQALLDKLEYARSGIIENLDEAEPELVYFKRLRK